MTFELDTKCKVQSTCIHYCKEGEPGSKAILIIHVYSRLCSISMSLNLPGQGEHISEISHILVLQLYVQLHIPSLDCISSYVCVVHTQWEFCHSTLAGEAVGVEEGKLSTIMTLMHLKKCTSSLLYANY